MIKGTLSWRQARTAGAVLSCFALLTLVFTRSWIYAAGIALGPFAGASAREWQSCCAQNSWSLAPYGLGFLLSGFAVQLLFRPTSPSIDRLRRIAWSSAWIGWCCCGVFSYGHALE
jgi:hypothetical protein